MRRRARWWLGYGFALVALAVVTAEVSLRFIDPAPQRYFIWPPHMHVVFEPSDQATPGISGSGHFMTNSLGLRSDEPLPDRRRTIYVFGGSTAADVYLDQREAWVTQTQDRLNAMPGQPKTWVGNFGRSSLASLHALMQFEHLVPTLPRADLFVMLAGANDLQLALKSSYLPDMTHADHMSWAFSRQPATGGLWSDLAIVRFWARLEDWRKRGAIGVTQTHRADGYITWRGCRQSAPPENLVRELPDLGPALAEYRGNLNRLVDRAQAYGAPMVFLTQPAMWSDRMDPQDAALLYAAGVGPNNVWCKDLRYYAPEAMAEGLARFNAVMLDVCRERALFCIDLAARVPRSRQIFWDDMHLNEAGAREVSRIVAAEIAALGPRLAALRGAPGTAPRKP
jgi:lysophospholipase L1-like esterase